VLFTESANHRTQRRSNIEVGSTLVAPIVDGGVVRGVLVCERVSHHPFQPGDLEAAMTAAPALGGLIACAPSAGSARRPAFLTGTIKV
jgi:GAF domain-containing protein